MAKIISVINDKGGVAKTTTVANLGTALWLLGKKVLVIDTDMQCNLTITFDKTGANTEDNLMTWMMGPKEAEPPVYERYDGLDYIPSSFNIKTLENFLRSKPGGDRYFAIRMAGIAHLYDYILIDCAPGCTSMLNTSVLEASTHIIVPTRTDTYSISGRGLLLSHIDDIRELGHNIDILGALITQFEPRTEMGKSVKEYFKDKPDMPLFPVTIKKCEEVNKAPSRQMTVFEYSPSCKAADEYMMLAEHIIWLFSGKTTHTPRKKNWTYKEWGEKANKAFTEFIKNQEG